MRAHLFLAFLTLSLAGSSTAAAAKQKAVAEKPAIESTCITCHAKLSDAALAPTKHIVDDIHFTKGLSCHDCHGGDPTLGGDDDIEKAHDPKKGWAGKPKRTSIPAFCAKCHANPEFMKKFNPQARVDQFAEYKTSVHGKKIAAGDERPAVCVDCHGVHGIRAVSDTRSSVHPSRLAETCSRCHADAKLMEPYKIPTKQYADYKTSVHAHAIYAKGDLSAPTCNDCHGSHGAAPPGVGSLDRVCESCHTRESALMKETEKKRGIDLSAKTCISCHENHAIHSPRDAMLGVGPDSTCVACHTPDDPQYRPVEEMGQATQTLKARLDEAHELLERAERAGMEVSPDRFALSQAQDKLVEVRTLIHAFDKERLLSTAKEGLSAAEAGFAAGQRAFAELRSRRMGLAASLVMIVGVIAGLIAKIKDLDGR